MERNEAKSLLSQLISAASVAMSAIDAVPVLRAKNDESSRIVTLQADMLRQLRDDLRKASKLANYYQGTDTVPPALKIDICPNCDGIGGFEYETPEGMDGEPCQVCNQTGLVPLAYATMVREEEAAKAKALAEKQPAERKEDIDDDLPF